MFKTHLFRYYMDHYILLTEIYEYLLINDKKKLIKCYNQYYLNEFLKEDLIKRYEKWIYYGKPTITSKFQIINEKYPFFNRNITSNELILIINNYEELCLSNKNNISDLILTINWGFDVVAIKMIKVFGDLCLPNTIYYNRTPLIYACTYSEKVAIKLLKTFGHSCHIDHIDNFGKTALDYAIGHSYMEVISLIKKYVK